MITATEVQEQEALMEYCQRFAQRVPALALLFHRRFTFRRGNPRALAVGGAPA